MKKSLMLVFALVISIMTFAHTPLLMVEDNEDGTVYAEGGFSNGASAGGIEILFVEDKPYKGSEETFEGKKIIYKGKLDEEGATDIIKPNVVSYQIVFNAGPGHIVYKSGIRISISERSDWKEKLEEIKEEKSISEKWIKNIENK